ncbi:hypothetical protein DFH08DRAFT_622557, partial [Mycena albidolilacea]
ALQSLAKELGSACFKDLPKPQQHLLMHRIIAGCCRHKDHNCSVYGVNGMEGVWVPLGLTPLVLLANKDNAATISLGD